MIGDKLNVKSSLLISEECGNEVGYPDIELVRLYSNQSKNCFYYVDSSTKEILEVFLIKNEDNDDQEV